MLAADLVTILGSMGGVAVLITAVVGFFAYRTTRRVSTQELALTSMEKALARSDKDRENDRARFDKRITELEAEMRERDERCARNIATLADQVRALGGEPMIGGRR